MFKYRSYLDYLRIILDHSSIIDWYSLIMYNYLHWYSIYHFWSHKYHALTIHWSLIIHWVSIDYWLTIHWSCINHPYSSIEQFWPHIDPILTIYWSSIHYPLTSNWSLINNSFIIYWPFVDLSIDHPLIPNWLFTDNLLIINWKFIVYSWSNAFHTFSINWQYWVLNWSSLYHYWSYIDSQLTIHRYSIDHILIIHSVINCRTLKIRKWPLSEKNPLIMKYWNASGSTFIIIEQSFKYVKINSCSNDEFILQWNYYLCSFFVSRCSCQHFDIWCINLWLVSTGSEALYFHRLIGGRLLPLR